MLTLLLTTLFASVCSPLPNAEWRDPQQDHQCSSFSTCNKKKADEFDFAGNYPKLENISIDGRRFREVALNLTGQYPLLESVDFQGGFGNIEGKFTGKFPKLDLIGITSTCASMKLDLRGEWVEDCHIHLRGTEGELSLQLPTDIGVTVHTKTTSAKITASAVEKQGWGILNKTFCNSLVESSPVQLTLHIEWPKGTILLD